MEGMKEGIGEIAQHLSGSELNSKLDELREKDKQGRIEKDAARKRYVAEMKAKHGDGELLFQTETIQNLDQAEREDYINWLKGFIQAGGEPTHFYDYNMPVDRWYKAKEDLRVPAMHGAASVSIIIPSGVEVSRISQESNPTFHDVGHNNLYFEDGYNAESGFVPVYKDTVFEEDK